MFPHRLRLLLGLASTLGLSSPVHANMVANGGFESGPTVPGSGYVQVPVGSTALSGWQVIQAPIDVVSTAWQSGEGSRSIALNSTAAPGGVAQTFATQPGRLYVVSFKLAGEPFTTPAIKRVRVRAAGQQADHEFDSAQAWHWAMFWSARSWTFVAQGSSTLIEFVSLTTADASPALDEIVVAEHVPTAAPSPATGLSLTLRSPNPARGVVELGFTLPAAGPALLEIVDVRGRRVATLARGSRAAGSHGVRWSGTGVASGVYLATLRTSHGALTRRFAFVR